MAISNQAIEASIQEATAPGFREQLLARGQARGMIWREGVIPEDAPVFSTLLSYDLLSFGYGLLSQGLRLSEQQGNKSLAKSAFEHAGEAIEAVVARGTNNSDRDFHRLVAAAAYHLGGFSARAFSLLHVSFETANLSAPEQCIGRLMLRNLDGLNDQITNWRQIGAGSDEALVSLLQNSRIADPQMSVDAAEDNTQSSALLDALDLALVDGFMTATGIAMLALERGESELLDTAVEKLTIGLQGAADFNFVPLWWCHRLTIHLLKDLWGASFHQRLPLTPPTDSAAEHWSELRELFIASLYRRKRSEIELWPSQLNAATRALDLNDNLVVSLPTSAGKTRIAEICILACLSANKRIVFVTPLRALSAQTEAILQRTFQPLGKTVSSLYGSIGASDVDADALKKRDIIVATPEKLDFALRNESALLDDVGLVVLDEGHMIGLGEREVRYEVQIQRLLRRSDAMTRRIICLSAILPSGDKLADFAAWLTGDKPDGLIQNDWRPTRLRFGDVDWTGSHAQLNIRVGDEKPFVPRFLTACTPPFGGRTTPFPKNQRELCLATAWRLIAEGQSVLIFCPERRSVEPYAVAIVDLCRRGALVSVLTHDPSLLSVALAIGLEWFPSLHPILECLKLGVAVHHGALPTPFRKEVERLLREGILKVTISSPTLAQGLNLSATALIFHGLNRFDGLVGRRKVIESSEFRNVVGRAGRAYVDLGGLVLYPMFDSKVTRRSEWKKLIASDGGREMESGLLRLVTTLILRIAKKLGTTDVDQVAEYVMNANDWTFPELNTETAETAVAEKSKWDSFMTSFDTAILSLLGEQTVTEDEIETKLDEILQSSLWTRRLAHYNESTQRILNLTMAARAKYVWAKTTSFDRRGYFLAGVGFDTGKRLDAKAVDLNRLLVQSNGAILTGDVESAVRSITDFAEMLFKIPPFAPDALPSNWKAVLETWLLGLPLAALGSDDEGNALQFIEHALIYKLPWGMEAVRVRGIAHNSLMDDDLTFSDFELGVAVACVETGSLNRSAALLIRSGFSSRMGAIEAVQDTAADFTTPKQLRRWMKSSDVIMRGWSPTWPSPETHELWIAFSESFDVPQRLVWGKSISTAPVDWKIGRIPPPRTALRIGQTPEDCGFVMTADYQHIGTLHKFANANRKGLLRVTASDDPSVVNLDYLGPDDLWV